MSTILDKISNKYLKEEQSTVRAGDTVRVSLRIVEGTKERVQAFEGVCIAKNRAGNASTITVRKISFATGVERIFPLNSPRVEKVEILQRGRVRRSKLYYLRGLSGKKARIRAKNEFVNK